MDLITSALDFGADVVGLASAERLLEKGASDPDILPSARTVIVVASAHSRTALASDNIQIKQYDTISAYENVRAVCHNLVKALEEIGHDALSVPAFIPIDMSDGKFGMVGTVDHRAAAVEAGIGCYGKSGLLLTRAFGPRIRLGSVLTSLGAEVHNDPTDGLCLQECTICLESCPTGALLGGGKIERQKCARKIFDYGLRRVMKFIGEMIKGSPEEREQLIKGYALRELWQNFMTGNYYYCFECQNLCPVGKKVVRMTG